MTYSVVRGGKWKNIMKDGGVSQKQVSSQVKLAISYVHRPVGRAHVDGEKKEKVKSIVV